MQKRIKLKPLAISLIYMITTITIVISLMVIGQDLLKEKPQLSYITTSTITEDIKDVLPVVKEQQTITRPYTDESVNILQNFYDNNSDKTIQEKSLIFYENTYLQNSGVDYGTKDSFEVNSIYGGKVLDVREDNILGKIVEIQHTNNLISSYQCLDKINVKTGDTVTIGEVIGTSGTCNINKDIGNHLHLEVSFDGKIINPEKIYEKSITEINA